LEAAKEKSAAGYTTLKWKIGVHAVESEQEIFAELLAALPEKVALRLDANGGLSHRELESWIEVLSPHLPRLDYLEQPLPPGEEQAMSEMAKASKLPIALDESLNMPGRERWLIPGAWEGPLVIKPLLMGNLSPLMEQLRPLAGQLVFSSVFETAVGLLHALDLADNLPRMKYAIGFDTSAAFDDDLSGFAPGPCVRVSERAKIDLEAIWKQLPPSS